MSLSLQYHEGLKAKDDLVMKVWFPMSATRTGSEVFTIQLANALSSRGIETVVTRYPKKIEAMPWFLSGYKPPEKTDIVHLNAGSAIGFLDCGIPSVITGHGAFERAVYDVYKSLSKKLYHSTLIRPGIKKAVARATVITAVSHWVADIYQQDYSASKVAVINNWVGVDKYSPVQKPLARKLLFVGRTAWQKGSHLLPQLSALLGDGIELTCTLENNEWAGKIPENIRLIGPVIQDKMPDLYRAHDALIVPSLAEGFCLAAAEAMACGLPVFGFRGHGLDDVLGPLASSCSSDMLDLHGLVNVIQGVFESAQTYSEISEQCRQRVVDHFTEEIALEKYISLYEKIVS
jgi:glycosyltransferase involved in cell wall biosynthesis